MPPTLFESGADAQCDAVITVVAKDEIRRKRIMARDGLTKEQAKARMEAQLSGNFWNSTAIICWSTTALRSSWKNRCWRWL